MRRVLLIILSNKKPIEILADPESLTFPATEDQYFEIALQEEICEWTIYGFFMCPDGLIEKPTDLKRLGWFTKNVDLGKKVLSLSTYVCLGGDDS